VAPHCSAQCEHRSTSSHLKVLISLVSIYLINLTPVRTQPQVGM
jgi:hypothetical protein